MRSVFIALSLASRDLLHPRIFALAVLPMLVAFILLSALAWWFWPDLMAAMANLLAMAGLHGRVFNWDLGWVGSALSLVTIVLLIIPLGYLVALLLTAVLAMPVMLNVIARKNYPGLTRLHGGSNLGSLVNAILTGCIYAALWLLALPLWLLPPVGFAVSIFLSAYLNQRVFRYDALAEHASREEMRLIRSRAGGRFWLLGVLLGFVQFVPLANFFAPLFIGLSFIHLGLNQLEKYRAETGLTPARNNLPPGQSRQAAR